MNFFRVAYEMLLNIQLVSKPTHKKKVGIVEFT